MMPYGFPYLLNMLRLQLISLFEKIDTITIKHPQCISASFTILCAPRIKIHGFYLKVLLRKSALAFIINNFLLGVLHVTCFSLHFFDFASPSAIVAALCLSL